MNGFTNSILTLLLGWLRSLFNAVWTLLGSEDGGTMITFFRQNWKTIFLVLCLGGFIIDRVIYFIRWRPYYVWGSKRRYRRAHRQQAEEDINGEEACQPQEDDGHTTVYAPPAGYRQAASYASPAPVGQTSTYASTAADGQTAVYAPPAAYARTQSPAQPQQTMRYQPAAYQAGTPGFAPAYHAAATPDTGAPPARR